MKTPLFTGCATALTTPFSENELDRKTLSSLIERQLSAGISALVVCGTTGEAATLSEREHDAIVDQTVSECRGKCRVIVGIGGNNTDKALDAARRAEKAGADGVLLTAPYYNKANTEGLQRHFTHVADGCGLPLIVYNVPSRTGVQCTAELYARLAEHGRINGIKEASGDLSLVSRTRALCGDAMHIWCGNDDQTVPMMSLGALGVISVASNVIPAQMAELCGHCLYGNFPAGRAIHEKYAKLFEVLFIEVNPIPVKEALAMMQLESGEMRLPLSPLSALHREELRCELQRLSLLTE